MELSMESTAATVGTRRNVKRAFLGAALVYIAYNILLSIVGLIVQLPDLTSTHAHTDHITVSQIAFSTGTIMSPPLFLVAIIGALTLVAAVRQPWLSAIGTALTVVAITFTGVEEATGLSTRPTLISPAKWDLVLVLSVVFVVVAASVLATGLWRLLRRD